MLNYAEPLARYYSPEEYLASEVEAEYKSEYFQGEIFAMAGGSVNHNRIAVNISTEFKMALRGKSCDVFSSDVRVLVQRNGLYTYPDAMLVCGKLEFAEGRDDTITNPKLIVEVLSKSTKNYDRGSKFTLYRGLPSLEHYILIDQDEVRVEYYHKQATGQWVLTELDNLEATLTLESLDLTISVRDIYDNVDGVSTG